MAQARLVLTDVAYAPNVFGCLEGADAAVIVTEWDAFRGLDLRRVKSALKTPVLVDLRNVFRPEEARAAGLTYLSVGRA